MSGTRTLADKLKDATAVSDTSGASVLMTDASGSLEKASVSLFARTVKMRLYKGEAIKISNIYSSFIACRGSLGSRASMIWVSAYGDGTSIRTKCAKIYHEGSYAFYVNGASEQACVYVTVNSENNDQVAVTSLFGETPIVKKVSSIPSDATPMQFTQIS